MASGFVIAAILETAGLIGLVLACIRIRAERRAKAAELRNFLRSGQSVSAPVEIGSAHHRRTARLVTVPYAMGRDRAGPSRDSVARSALRRALVPGSQPFHPDHTLPLSAG